MGKALKIGLIGTGRIARRHLAAYVRFQEQVQLTAVCDIVEAAARDYAKKASVAAIYTDPAKMLKQADIDAVDICAIHDQNAALAIAAAEAGKHVLVEKPMATTMHDCHAVLEATSKAGVTFMVAQMLRYVPYSRAIWRLVQAGELGAVRAARGDALANGIQLMEQQSWYSDPKRSGGGAVISLAIHPIDLLRYFIGDVKRVIAVCSTTHPAFPKGIEDHASAILEFENGALAEVSADFAARRAPWVWNFLVVGNQGTIASFLPFREQFGQQRWDATVGSIRRSKEMKASSSEHVDFFPIEPDRMGLVGDDPYVNEIIHFAACCHDGTEPISSGRNNLGTIRTVLGIYESASTGKPIDLASH